jgi:hypothetical protein
MGNDVSLSLGEGLIKFFKTRLLNLLHQLLESRVFSTLDCL